MYPRKILERGKEQKIRIESSSGLNKDEVDKLVKEAEAHASEDKAKHELISARNQLDNLVYATENSLKEHGDKATAEEKTAIEEALKEAKENTQAEDLEKIKAVTEKLTQASHALAQKIYEEAAKKQQAAQGAAPEGSGGSAEKGKDENVVDADYEVVDEENKKEEKK